MAEIHTSDDIEILIREGIDYGTMVTPYPAFYAQYNEWNGAFRQAAESVRRDLQYGQGLKEELLGQDALLNPIVEAVRRAQREALR